MFAQCVGIKSPLGTPTSQLGSPRLNLHYPAMAPESKQVTTQVLGLSQIKFPVPDFSLDQLNCYGHLRSEQVDGAFSRSLFLKIKNDGVWTQCIPLKTKRNCGFEGRGRRWRR